MTITEFSVFDYPHQVLHLQVTEGHTDQATGEWVAGSTVETAITGHLQDLTYKDLQRMPEGEYEIGDRRIITDADLESGDLIRVTEPDDTVTEWRVKTRERRAHILAAHDIERTSYLLKRR